MAAVMKTALAAICVATQLATAYLTASLLILHPPRANYRQWFLSAALFVAQGALTLAALGMGRQKRLHDDWLRLSDGVLRWPVVAGGGAIIWIGVSWIRATLSGSHFEGYALVLGSALALQGALTLAVFLPVDAVLGRFARDPTSR